MMQDRPLKKNENCNNKWVMVKPTVIWESDRRHGREVKIKRPKKKRIDSAKLRAILAVRKEACGWWPTNSFRFHSKNVERMPFGCKWRAITVKMGADRVKFE
jgi:hypothetical protein